MVRRSCVTGSSLDPPDADKDSPWRRLQALRVAKSQAAAASRLADILRHRAGMALEVFVGRSLAVFVHPLAGWRSRWRTARLLIVAGYFLAGYTTVLAALIAF